MDKMKFLKWVISGLRRWGKGQEGVFIGLGGPRFKKVLAYKDEFLNFKKLRYLLFKQKQCCCFILVFKKMKRLSRDQGREMYVKSRWGKIGEPYPIKIYLTQYKMN